MCGGSASARRDIGIVSRGGALLLGLLWAFAFGRWLLPRP
jgi:hypothetical protein